MEYAEHFANLFGIGINKPFFLVEKPNHSYMFTTDTLVWNDGTFDGWKEIDPNSDLITKMMLGSVTIVDKKEDLRDLNKIFNIGSSKEFLISGKASIDCYIFKIENNKLYAKFRYDDGAQWNHYCNEALLFTNEDSIVHSLQNGNCYITPIKQISVVTSSLSLDEMIIVEEHTDTETFEISMYGNEGWNTAKFSKADFTKFAKDMIKGIIKNPFT